MRIAWALALAVNVLTTLSFFEARAELRPTVVPDIESAHPLDHAPGYLDSVTKEKEVPKDIVIHLPPSAKHKPVPISDRIFNQRLSTEFVQRYEQVFGRTTAERTYVLQNNPFEYQSSVTGFQMTAVQTNQQQRAYGEYVFRRLAEFHVDNYFRTDPEMKTVYEVKEKISKGEVAVAPGFSVTGQYNFGGNFIDLILKNPYLDSSVRLDVGGSAGTTAGEATVTLRKQITDTVGVESYYAVTDGVAKLITRKRWTSRFESSLLGSTYTKDSGYTVRETLGLAGFAFVF